MSGVTLAYLLLGIASACVLGAHTLLPAGACATIAGS